MIIRHVILLFILVNTLPVFGEATVVSMRGDVRLENQKTLIAGQVLSEGKILTGEESSIRLLIGQDVVDIGPNSSFSIGETEKHEAPMKLDFGRVKGIIKKRNRKRQFRFKLRSTVIAVRGTEFVAQSDQDTNDLDVTVISGSVEVTEGNKTIARLGAQTKLVASFAINQEPLSKSEVIANQTIYNISEVEADAISEESSHPITVINHRSEGVEEFQHTKTPLEELYEVDSSEEADEILDSIDWEKDSDIEVTQRVEDEIFGVPGDPINIDNATSITVRVVFQS